MEIQPTNRTYKIAEKNDSPYETLVEVGNINSTIRVGDITQNIKNLEKHILELRGKRKIEKATMENLKNNRPELFAQLLPNKEDSAEVKREKGEQLTAIFIYVKAEAEAKELYRNLGLCMDAIKSEKQTLKEIEESLGIKVEL
jgi:hypothetical protein